MPRMSAFRIAFHAIQADQRQWEEIAESYEHMDIDLPMVALIKTGAEWLRVRRDWTHYHNKMERQRLRALAMLESRQAAELRQQVLESHGTVVTLKRPLQKVSG